MKTLLVFCLWLVPGIHQPAGQDLLNGTFKYVLNYHIPDQGRKAMEKSGFAVTTGMEIKANGSSLNVKILSANGVKMEMLYTPSGSYYIDRSNRKAYKMQPREAVKPDSALHIVKTEEFETVLGHSCRKYIVESDAGDKQLVWVTADYRLDYDIYQHVFGNNGSAAYASQIEGLPLKIAPGDNNTLFDMKAVSIDNSKPDPSEFVLAEDFKILNYDPVIIGKMMMGEQY